MTDIERFKVFELRHILRFAYIHFNGKMTPGEQKILLKIDRSFGRLIVEMDC